MDRSYLRRIEREGNPTLEKIYELASILNLYPSNFFPE